MKNYICLFTAVLLWCALMPSLVKPAIEGQAIGDYETSEDSLSAENLDSVFYLDVESNENIKIELEDYVARALSSTMQKGTPVEALKAQAVAIRSVVCYRYENKEHEDYYLCLDSEHCFNLAESPRDDCVKAAQETAGLILTCEGKAALALSHYSSLIKTESYETVYGKKLPYLVSVPVYNESGMYGYKRIISIKLESFKDAFSDYTVIFSDDSVKWIGNVEFTQGGRVYTAEIGGLRFKGSTIARLFGLESLCFNIDVKEDEVIIQCYGNGHGIGMSRNTAILMAEEGKNYKTILEYFYPNTSFSVIKAYKQN